jgi:Restriction endonuclease
MDSLRQRLKELDPERFEELVFSLVEARHPGAGIKRVEGASGDQGVDIFAGLLADGATIWQAKNFRNGIGKSQRQQIRDSLRRVLPQIKPARWILCVSIDLNVESHKWFQALAESCSDEVTVGIMQASDIVSQLLYQKTIKDHFFPGAGLDVNELRALITNTGEYTELQLRDITSENASQFIERLKQRDARYNYEVVVSTDRPPTTATDPAFSIASGPTLVNAYPRDIEALRADPVRLRVQFKGTGVDKIKAFMQTGKSADFQADELAEVRSTLGLPELHEFQTLRLAQRAGREPLAMRVTFGKINHGVTYELINFRLVRVGTDEAELASESKLPFTLTVLARQKQVIFNIEECLGGAPLKAVKKYADAISAFDKCRELHFFDLEHERPFFDLTADTAIPAFDPGLVRLVNDALKVAEAYGVELRMPENVTQEDAETIMFLERLLLGELPGFETVTCTIAKDGSEEDWMRGVVEGTGNAGCRLSHEGLTRHFGGIPINTGPFDIAIDQLRFEEPEATLNEYRAAQTGSALTVKCVAVTKPRAQRITAT